MLQGFWTIFSLGAPDNKEPSLKLYYTKEMTIKQFKNINENFYKTFCFTQLFIPPRSQHLLIMSQIYKYIYFQVKMITT